MHEWSRRHPLTRGERDALRTHLAPVRLATRSVDHVSTTAVLRGNSAEARAIYPLLYWEANESPSRAAVDYARLPLDVLVVERHKGAPKFFVDDPSYRKTTDGYQLIDASCIVCTRVKERYSIVCVFVTERAVPSFGALCDDARAAQREARANLVPRHSFAVGGDYARDPDYREKRANVMEERMKGTIWNDGLQTWTTATPGWQGQYFTQYFRRRPGTSVVPFAHPYVAIYAHEKAIVPAVAKRRLKLSADAKLPCAFRGLARSWMPATQVGMSEDFSVKVHNDSCIAGVTESIFWANRGLDKQRLRFAVTSCRVQFNIGTQPCLLFMKGNEAHGTVPGGKGSCGLVLISKRNTLQQFEPGGFTDLTRAIPATPRGGNGSGDRETET